jgi:hypothetical protein
MIIECKIGLLVWNFRKNFIEFSLIFTHFDVIPQSKGIKLSIFFNYFIS